MKYALILPLLFIIALLSIAPFVRLVQVAFQTYIPTKALMVYSGLANYHKMLGDKVFWNSINKTILFVSVSIVFEFIIGLGLALLVKDIVKFRSLIRTLFLIPMLTAPVGVGMVWKLIYKSDIGLINMFLQRIHLGMLSRPWLADFRLAMPAIILVEVWQWTPFMFLFLLAGLEFIPKEPYDAAAVDGASAPQAFWHITLPLLKPVIATSLLLRTVGLFKAFGKFYVLTGGGPSDATEVINIRLYKVTFFFCEFGYGSFLALTSLVFVGAYALAYAIVIRKLRI